MASEKKIFELMDDSIFVCDMRPGFTEDGVMCELPNGNYILSIESATTQDMNSFSIQLENAIADDEAEIATLDVDMARVGIYKSKLLVDGFKSDTEALFEWSDSECDKNSNPWGGHVGNDSSPDGLYFHMGSDCECSVKYLLSNKSKVGLKVVPLSTPDQPTVDRSWTWIEVALSNSELSFVHDRDYDLEFEDVLENVLTELCSIDEGASLTFVEESNVNVEEEIKRFRPNFKSAIKCEVFFQSSTNGELTYQKLPLDTSKAIDQLDENITVKDFANVIYGIFKTARHLEK